MQKIAEVGPPLLRARGISVVVPGSRSGVLRRRAGAVRVLDRLSLDVGVGDLVWLVGAPESGAVEAAAVLSGRLAPTAGGVDFEGRPVAGLGRRQRAAVRRQVVGLDAEVDPTLDPKRTATAIVATALTESARSVGPEELTRSRHLLVELGVSAERIEGPAADLDDAEARLVAAARTVATAPRVVIYRPWSTPGGSGLDQDSVWGALRGLRAESATALVVVSELLPDDLAPGERALIVCGGRLVEVLGCADVRRPLHPYTLTLVARDSVGASTDGSAAPRGIAALDVLHDEGCPFRPGCPRAKARCARMPELDRPLGATHEVACHFPEDPRGPAAPGAARTEARLAAGGKGEPPGEGDEPTAREFAQG